MKRVFFLDMDKKRGVFESYWGRIFEVFNFSLNFRLGCVKYKCV